MLNRASPTASGRDRSRGRRSDDLASVATAALRCRDVTVSYEGVVALDGVNLDVGAGEAVALLGPSGSGKTTLLHAVAGFLPLSEGEIAVGATVVARPRRALPPERRSVGVVFQHYALWPHMTALQIVAYPLRQRGVPAAAARERAGELLERMHVRALADRRPETMSGGQQQRVGLARALARDAAVYLFDEPTAHLDTSLRAALQEEIAQRRRELGAAAVHATHDAGEALAVADRLVLLGEGRIVQQGTPQEVYEQPANRWSALLTGPASVLHAPVRTRADGTVVLTVGDRDVTVSAGVAPSAAPAPARALLRPEWVALGGPVPAAVDAIWYRGSHTDYRMTTAAGAIDARELGPPRAQIGDRPGVTLRRVWLIAT